MQYPEAKTIHLVMDNLNIHRRKSLTDLFGAEIGGEVWDRFTVHYTPTHGSWLNQAEIEIGIFSRQCLGKQKNPRPEDSAPGKPSLESPHEPRPHQDQLEVRPQSRPPQVRLQKKLFQAVKDLVSFCGRIALLGGIDRGASSFPQGKKVGRARNGAPVGDSCPIARQKGAGQRLF